jgi:hypothetical protein
VGSHVRYQEAWMARGPLVLLVTRLGRRADAAMASALAGLAALPLSTTPVGVDASPAAVDALAALAPPAHLPAPAPSAAWLASRLDLTNPAPCVAGTLAAAQEAAPAGRWYLVEVGLECARLSRDKAGLQALAAVPGLGARQDEVWATAARSLIVLGARKEGFALAHKIGDGSEESRADRRGLALVEAAIGGSWAATRAGLDDPTLPEIDRANAALALLGGAHVQEGRRVLRALCAARPAAAVPDWCEQVPDL